MPVRVLLDATSVPADRGGVGRYVDELLPLLDGDGIQLLVVCQERDLETYATVLPAERVTAAPARIARRPDRLIWEQTGLASLARRLGADVLHSPHYSMPHVAAVPTVVTLHDATFFTLPALHSGLKARYFRQATRYAVRHAAALVVPSRATRDEVLREAGGDPQSFVVAYHGVDRTIFHPAADDDRKRVLATLGLTDDAVYIGFLGTLEPRKNVPALVSAWAEAFGSAATPPALVLAGGRGWDEEVDRAVAAVPDRLTVLRPGYLPLGDLPGFLSGAAVLAYPSLGEGFGLPVLEAMACGAAVLTTRELSLPEVGGDAVAYCGTSADDISRELSRLMDDAAERSRLSGLAVDRATEFTWERAADAHRVAYRHAAAAR